MTKADIRRNRREPTWAAAPSSRPRSPPVDRAQGGRPCNKDHGAASSTTWGPATARVTLRVVLDSLPDDPALDTAVSRALLERVAAGELPETLRLARPGPMVAFGKLDVVGPGYREAVAAARAGGFEAIERLAGGRAAVFHEGTRRRSRTRSPTPTRARGCARASTRSPTGWPAR